MMNARDFGAERTPQRHVCTKDDPAKPGQQWVIHPDANEIGGGDYTVRYLCQWCGNTWTEELPE